MEIGWQIGVAWFVDANARSFGQRRRHRVARSGDRAAENVEARADVADAPGRERTNRRRVGIRGRAGVSGSGAGG